LFCKLKKKKKKKEKEKEEMTKKKKKKKKKEEKKKKKKKKEKKRDVGKIWREKRRKNRGDTRASTSNQDVNKRRKDTLFSKFSR
jgi:outer membrane biosynthesis protein TonB